jgi:hypothetical protein
MMRMGAECLSCWKIPENGTRGSTDEALQPPPAPAAGLEERKPELTEAQIASLLGASRHTVRLRVAVRTAGGNLAEVSGLAEDRALETAPKTA